jgi:type 1 glutamine amidotransferase
MFIKTFYLALLVGLTMPGWMARAAEPPKKLLVVTTTMGFRHASIPALKQLLARLAQSSGEFTVDYLDEPEGKPPDVPKNATPEEKAAHEASELAWEETKLKPALQRLAPAALQGYDGVVFASTTGDLPLPDREGFLAWIKAGHAFIGLHSASDTLHHWPGYAQMMGGEFDHHGPQVGVVIVNADPAHPATAGLPASWTLTQEEIYQFKNYDVAKVHELLYMNQNPNTLQPGHYPLAWCREYGQGRVFYTALGHRDDIINPDPALPDRKNAVAISQAYDAHVLGGIEWALGLKR